MSEENSQLPSLRLKPRIRVESAPPPPVPAVPPPSSAGESADSPRPVPAPGMPRLRPKILTAETAPEGAHFAAPLPDNVLPTPALPPPSMPAPVFPPPVMPTATLPAAVLPEPFMPAPAAHSLPAPTASTPDSLEVGRFKLKPRTATGQAESPSLPIASLPAAAISSAPQGIKVVATAPSGSVMPPKAPPFVRAAPAPAAPAPAPGRKNSLSRSFKRNLIALAVFAALAVGVGGFLALRLMTRMEKKNEEPSPTKTFIPHHPPGEAAAPKTDLKVPVVANPQSLPGKLVGKARDVAAAHDASGQVQDLNQVLDSDGSAPKTAASPAGEHPNVASAPEKNGGDSSTSGAANPPAPAKVVVLEPAKPTPPPQPSSAFKALVVNLHISGVFQGDPARALLNGRMVHAGEIVDSSLNVKFIGLDSSKKNLLFQDDTGAIMPRHF